MKHLGEAHKLLSPAAKRKLGLADEVHDSLTDTMAVAKHSGTAIATRARAYRHVKAIVLKTSGLRRYFELRHHRAANESNWWQQTISQRKKKKDVTGSPMKTKQLSVTSDFPLMLAARCQTGEQWSVWSMLKERESRYRNI